MDKSKIWSHFGGPYRRERERGEEKRDEEGEKKRKKKEEEKKKIKFRYVFNLGSSVFLFPKALVWRIVPPLSRVLWKDHTNPRNIETKVGKTPNVQEKNMESSL